MPPYTVAPFVILLLAIALLPLWLPHWWESNRSKLIVSARLGLAGAASSTGTCSPAPSSHGRGLRVVHRPAGRPLRDRGRDPAAGRSGGDARSSTPPSWPPARCSPRFIGTTGASMLLIRAAPADEPRARRASRHTVVFFIFLVSNIGGMLTPLGDPPLFLGYLPGCPFSWTFRLWPPWLSMVAVAARRLLRLGHAPVRAASRVAAPPPRSRRRSSRCASHGAPERRSGWSAWSSRWRSCTRPGASSPILALAGLSLWRTPRRVRRAEPVHRAADGRSRRPVPRDLPDDDPRARAAARARRRARRARARGTSSGRPACSRRSSTTRPPTSTFLALGQGLGLPGEVVGVPHAILAAISVGAVSWAPTPTSATRPTSWSRPSPRRRACAMPSFFGYMLYSGAVLLPLFVAVTLLFFW